MSESQFPFTSIVDALNAVATCTEHGARFIPRTGEPTFFPYSDIITRAKGAAGALQARGLRPGDRVAIILTTSIQFFDAFLGVQFAGGIPAALYPPFRFGKLQEYYERTRTMLTTIGARFLITDNRIGKLLGPVAADVSSIRKILYPFDLRGSFPSAVPSVDPASPAFLQFSSGTTVDPKAVIVSHTALIHNLEAMGTVFRMYPDARKEAVCWLPLYHDMGLVGCLFNGLYHPATMNYIGPETFIAKPALWLQAISRYRASVSPAPQFAYNYCTKKIRDDEMTGVDLSDWIAALNGAEPIDIEGMRRFSQRFTRWGFRETAMTPVYGLAEAGLAVTFSDWRTPPLVTSFNAELLSDEKRVATGTGRELAAVGQPLKGLHVRISDEADIPLEDGRVGKIMIRGLSVTPGYFNNSEATKNAIRKEWFDTGDLGFFYDENLYITGRTKDLVIIRGRNIAPHEIERLLEGIEGIRAGCYVATGTAIEGQGEQLILLAEEDTRVRRPEEKLEQCIREVVTAHIGVNPYHVQILKPGTLPRTSSGKMRRQEALRLFLTGKLVPPEKMGIFKMLREVGKSHIAWGRFRLQRRRSHERTVDSDKTGDS